MRQCGPSLAAVDCSASPRPAWNRAVGCGSPFLGLLGDRAMKDIVPSGQERVLKLPCVDAQSEIALPIGGDLLHHLPVVRLGRGG